jgi:molecular chaperone HtpG
LRYEAIAAPDLITDGAPPKIRIVPDKKANMLAVIDNGIGMTRQELIENLGTIARSGTKSFLSRLSEAKEGASLIGQFGVGFYAAFMVAERIVVTSRRAGTDEVWVWSSSGGSGFEIAPASAEDAARIARGTEIVLHLKEDAKKYLETYEIERIVRDYSDNIQFPIELVAEEGEPRQINSASALWQRSKSELTAEDYNQAYKSIAGAFDEPAMTLHYRAEGRQSYAVLLFAPSTKPFDLFEPARKGKVKLYVRRVFIADDADILPAYLRFIRGVIDSEDLPLNISREMLQNNPQLAQIRKAVTGRVISELESLSEKEPETFTKIWDAFGPVIKEGLWEDYERREALAQAICRSHQAQPDRYLLSDRREPRSAEVESEARGRQGAWRRGVAADRSGRCVLDFGPTRFRRQAVEVAESGRYRFWSDPGAGGKIRGSGQAGGR